MSRSNTYTWSTIGLLALLACGNGKTDGLDVNPSTGSGATHAGGAGPSGTVTGNAGTGAKGTLASNGGSTFTGTIGAGSTGAGASTSDNTGSGSTGSTGTGSTGSGSTGSTGTGSAAATRGGAGGGPNTSTNGGSETFDPPPSTGGSGQTYDPPAGGSGVTQDPPGGSGNTQDPPGGSGNTTDPPPGDTTDPPPGDTTDPPPGDTIDPPPGCTMTEIDKVNVIVFDNATPSGADSEGKMWVGGNATFSSGYAVASTQTSIADCSDYGLVVGGDLTVAGSGKVVGKAAYGNELIRMPGSNLTFTCGAWNETPVDFANVEAKLKRYSLAFKAYPANGSATVNGSTLTFVGTSTTLNVFSISAAQLNNNIKFVVPEKSSVVVNVSGIDVTWQGVGFSMPDGASCRGGTSDWCHRILWNLYEAQSLYLSGIGVQGSILAPYATVDGGGGNIDGQLVCENLTGAIEYHPYFFTGCLLLPKA